MEHADQDGHAAPPASGQEHGVSHPAPEEHHPAPAVHAEPTPESHAAPAGHKHETPHEAGHPTPGGHGAKSSLGKPVGITMAILGVLLAICSAMVGGSRSELIAAKVEQTNALVKQQSVSTKYRMMLSVLQQLHSLMPDPATFRAGQQRVDELQSQVRQPALRNLAAMSQLETSLVLNTVTPTTSDMRKFAAVVRILDTARQRTDAWVESYNDKIDVLAEAAEHYEWAQLAAELGIVLCAVAMLLDLKPVWYVAVASGTLCLLVVMLTAITSSSGVEEAGARIVSTHQAYLDLKSPSDKVETEALLKSVEQPGDSH